ncbi:hypothetical protein KEM52_002539 [Ascosphaera acerosa]|nr:hypothetical protein KEM52_002539 [Ascosphaera acerosa]
MHTQTLNFLRLLTFVHRILLLLASVLVFGVFTYFLSTRADHEMGFPKWISAVEGISGIAMLYALVMCIITLPYGGHSTVAMFALVMDMLLIPAFVAVAIMNRKVLKKCDGTIDTALGKGKGRDKAVGFGKEGFGVTKGKETNVVYMVRYDTACKLQKCAFWSSIAAIVILLGTLFAHYYYRMTFRTAQREGLPSAYRRRPFGLWPFGHTASDEEKALQERIKGYTSKGYSNRPDQVPVERPVHGPLQRRRAQGGGDNGPGGDSGGGSDGSRVKRLFHKMMPGHHGDSGDQSDEEPLHARYQYPHHDMRGEKYLQEGNAASEHGGGDRVPPPDGGHDDGDGDGQGGYAGYDDVNLHDGDNYSESRYTNAPSTQESRSPSEPTSWAERKKREMEQERQQRAQQGRKPTHGKARGNGDVDGGGRDPDESPRQQAARQYAQEQEYADRAKGDRHERHDDVEQDPRSAAAHLKRETKRGANAQKHGEQGQDYDPGYRVHPQGTGHRGQEHPAPADGPHHAGQGAGALRDAPYGPKDVAPGLANKGVPAQQAKRAYGRRQPTPYSPSPESPWASPSRLQQD